MKGSWELARLGKLGKKLAKKLFVNELDEKLSISCEMSWKR